jgi:type I restriction enzyme S subunit
MIPEDWKVIRLGEKVNITMGQSPPSSTYNVTGNGLPFFQGRRDFGSRNPAITTWCSEPKKKAKKGEILLSVRAPIGDINISDKECCIGRGLSALSWKNESNEFLFYLLKHNQRKLQSTFESGGTVFGCVSKDGLSDFLVAIPENEKEQTAIAKILSDPDSKIELNQQMNKTLEAIGQAVFKRWFVDFEFPNEEGKPYKSSGGEMINSALGEIPKNWEVKSVGDVLELAYGRALKETVRQAGSTPVYGSNGQIGWHNEKLVKGPGIVVGRKGNPGTVLWSETDFFPIDTTFYVVPKDTAKSLHYLFYVLKNQGLELLSADSAVPGLNRNIVYMNPILVPTPTILSQFDAIIQGFFYKVQNNNEQIAILSQLRDSLLPKLMSGKIRVPIQKETVEVQ